MLQNLRSRAQSEEGFTLIELLVVILIIGILAAIALPTFLSQKDKSNDADAKSNARNIVSHVESCFVDAQDYASCDTDASTELGTGTGLPLVNGAPGSTDKGKVGISNASTTGYTVTAFSKSGRKFVITKSNTGTSRTRTATDGSTADGSW